MVYGRGLQDCFMSMLRYVVRFFQGIHGLLWHDLWNEPYPGPVGQAADTIRSLDPEAFLFTEACYFTNMGVPSGIERLSDSGQVFEPHGYDLIVDTRHDDLYDSGRVEPISRILERNLWSHTYWFWRPDIEGAPEWGELVRAYPVATAGTLLYYRWEGDCITLEYDGVPGCTEVFAPNLGQGTWGVRRLQEHVWPDTKHGVLRIRSDRAQNVRLCFGRVAGAYGGAVHDPLDL